MILLDLPGRVKIRFNNDEVAEGFARGFSWAIKTRDESVPDEFADIPGFVRGARFYLSFTIFCEKHGVCIRFPELWKDGKQVPVYKKMK